jgi:hypothetical protein
MEEMGELLRDAANTACGGTPKPPGRFYRKGAKVAKNRGGGFFDTMMSFAAFAALRFIPSPISSDQKSTIGVHQS